MSEEKPETKEPDENPQEEAEAAEAKAERQRAIESQEKEVVIFPESDG